MKATFDEKDLMTHMLIAGSTGTGKSIAAMLIAEEALKQNIPVVVCNPTAQWTGFLSNCRDRALLKAYRKFGMKKEDATAFRNRILNDVSRIDFRKCMIMTSQLLSDFSDEIRNNILTEIQMHTKSLADIDRVQQKYGTELELAKDKLHSCKFEMAKMQVAAIEKKLH